ncbi:MAG: magnesium/cobalt transporter CorA [Spirochaetes bacterium]|nr:magnesium/cobalt transporter CorA [Spirochaetota bacterium]
MCTIGTNWINVNGLSGGMLERLCVAYGVNSLVVEDILNTEHRPKIEYYDNFAFIVTKMIRPIDEYIIEFEQVSIIVTHDTVITFQEQPGDCFDPIRERISTATGRVRRERADFLAYALIDVIVDTYFPVLDRLGTRLEVFELAASDPKVSRDFMVGLQDIKRELFHMRRVVWPTRETISTLLRRESDFFDRGLEPFWRDVYENTVQVAEALETYREADTSILEVYLSSVSNRMNEIMKVLTIISTIFIPLTFIAGVYGMNFEYMPELGKKWAYPAVWGVMGSIAIGLLLYFRKKKWI